MDDYHFLFGQDVISCGNKFKIHSRDIDFIIKFYLLAIQASLNHLNINTNQVKYLSIGLPPEDLNKTSANKLKNTIISAKINNRIFPWKKRIYRSGIILKHLRRYQAKLEEIINIIKYPHEAHNDYAELV